jgi:mono/diheme cytochrome c family protein
MLRIIGALVIVVTIVLIAINVINFYDDRLQVGRMWETPAVKPHEQPIPVMSGMSVPVNDAELFFRTSDPDTLAAPFDLADAQAIDQGRRAYVYYCIQCHGANHDGYGTVGQSFAPAPGDLRSMRVQQALPVGRIFHEISYGIPGGRQPPLAGTIAVQERWQIIAFIRSLGIRP